MPEGMEIDHINRNRSDNRECNLRLVTRAENIANKACNKNSSSGWKGVGWHKASKKWRARITYKGNKIDIGSVETLYTAISMYNIYALSLHDPHIYINPLPRYGTEAFKNLFWEE